MEIITCFTFILLYFLIRISIEDAKTMLISEHKLILFALSGLLYLIILGSYSKGIKVIDLIVNNCFSTFLIFIMMYLISYISYNIFKITSLGMGDIKLSSSSTIWLGIELSLISLCISFLLSGIYCLYGKITKKLMPFQQYPFAPFLSIGIFCSWIIDKI